MTDLEVVSDALSRLSALGRRPIIGGSFASSAWGRPRQTHDLDIAVSLRPEHVDSLTGAFSNDYVVNREEVQAALADGSWPSTFQLLHYESTFKIDVFLGGIEPYDRLVAEAAKPIEIVPGVLARYVSAEDIVLQKLRSYDLGNRVSDRQ